MFGFVSKGSGAKKPKRYYEVNAGTYKVQVHDTNNTQQLLSEQRSHIMRGTSGIAIALCELTPQQKEANFPGDHCLNVCVKGSKYCTDDNYMGYIDVDRAKVGYLKQVVAEYQVVEAHASMTDNGDKYRMSVLFQPPENRKKKGK